MHEIKLRVEIGDFTITADSLNYIVTETERLREKDDGTMGKTGIGSRFFGKLPAAINYILEQKIKESAATSIKELRDEFIRLKVWIEGQFEES